LQKGGSGGGGGSGTACFVLAALVVSACMRVTDFAKAGASRRAKVK
jgi:hypothetical protein